jgi:NADP-dependent 3-hydroxy acid dehydrogenase YdfG
MKFDSFDGKNIHLFGGSSGIGLATAKQLANLGANIFIYARTEQRLKPAELEIKKTVRLVDKRLSGYPSIYLFLKMYNKLLLQLSKNMEHPIF